MEEVRCYSNFSKYIFPRGDDLDAGAAHTQVITVQVTSVCARLLRERVIWFARAV